MATLFLWWYEEEEVEPPDPEPGELPLCPPYLFGVYTESGRPPYRWWDGVPPPPPPLAALLLALSLSGEERSVGVTAPPAARRSGVREPLRCCWCCWLWFLLLLLSSSSSSSEKSVDPSSCERCQSMLTFSNMVFLRWRACSSCGRERK